MEKRLGMNLSHSLPSGYAKNLGGVDGNGNRGLARVEELVASRTSSGKHKTNNPNTNGRDRGGRVVGVGNDGADLRISRVVWQKHDEPRYFASVTVLKKAYRARMQMRPGARPGFWDTR